MLALVLLLLLQALTLAMGKASSGIERRINTITGLIHSCSSGCCLHAAAAATPAQNACGHCHVTTPAPLRKSRSTNAVLEKVDACGLPACIIVSRQCLTAGITATRCCPCSCQLHAAVPLACPQACTPDAGFVGSVSCGLSAVTGCAGADGEGVAFFISAMGLRTRLSAPICA